MMGKEGAQLPRHTNVPEMTYGCGYASMFTYGTCIAATSCHACKERGSVTKTDGKPNCDICSCVCTIGAFKQSEIVELRIRHVQEQESAAKAANPPKDDIFSRANMSLASMMKRSVTEVANIISQSSLTPPRRILFQLQPQLVCQGSSPRVRRFSTTSSINRVHHQGG